MDRGGSLTHKLLQMLMKGNFSSLPVENKEIEVCLGWDVSPTWDEGLHTFLGVVGCCMKGNGEEQFEFVNHNVSADDMNKGKLEHAKFGKVNLNNHVSLSHRSILPRAYQWARFCMKKHLGFTLPGTFFHMCTSGQFYLNPIWVVPMRSMNMDVKKVTLIWKIMMNLMIYQWKISQMSSLIPFRQCQT